MDQLKDSSITVMSMGSKASKGRRYGEKNLAQYIFILQQRSLNALCDCHCQLSGGYKTLHQWEDETFPPFVISGFSSSARRNCISLNHNSLRSSLWVNLGFVNVNTVPQIKEDVLENTENSKIYSVKQKEREGITKTSFEDEFVNVRSLLRHWCSVGGEDDAGEARMVAVMFENDPGLGAAPPVWIKLGVWGISTFSGPTFDVGNKRESNCFSNASSTSFREPKVDTDWDTDMAGFWLFLNESQYMHAKPEKNMYTRLL